MGAASRRKGKQGELEVAHAFAAALGVDARRGLSQARGGGAEEPDVVLPGLPYHLEVKRGACPNPRAALRQACEDAAEGRTPIAVIRDDRAEAFAVLLLADLLVLLAGLPREAEP